MRAMAGVSRRFLALLAALVAVGLPALARAHEVGLSRGAYTVVGEVVSAELTFARRELAGAVPELDPDRDGVLSGEEVDRAKAALGRSIVDRVKVTSEGAPCPGQLDSASLVEEDGIALRASFRCPAGRALALARVELGIFEELPHGHRHIARTASGENVLFRGNRSLDVAAAGSAPPPESSKPSVLGFLFMGLEHILLGFDHLVFLLGLVLVGGRIRSLLLVVTAFTVAHSITLGAAVLGLWAPSPSIVEPLIALSIVYVGVENFFVKDAEKRWRVTLPFGLVHGFGFAGALGEIALPRAEVPAALLAFNVGVELGQVAVLALVLPLILAAKKKAWFEKTGVKAISAAIVAAGLFWFVTRVFGIELF